MISAGLFASSAGWAASKKPFPLGKLFRRCTCVTQGHAASTARKHFPVVFADKTSCGRTYKLQYNFSQIDLLDHDVVRENLLKTEGPDVAFRDAPEHLLFVLSPQELEQIAAVRAESPLFSQIPAKRFEDIPKKEGVYVLQNPNRAGQFFLFFIVSRLEKLPKLIEHAQNLTLTDALIYVPKHSLN